MSGSRDRQACTILGGIFSPAGLKSLFRAFRPVR